jgi:calcium-dependent protein kinase
MGCSGSTVNQEENDGQSNKKSHRLTTKTSNYNNFEGGDQKKSKFLIENNVILNTDPIKIHYKVLEKIGSGSFGKVFKGLHKSTNQLRAIKVVKKTMLKYQDGDKTFLKEIEMLVGLDHISIIKVFEYFEDEQNYYVIEELADGGELYEQLYKLNCFSENLAARIMKQIVSAIIYLHDNNIVHRDLKPENILLHTQHDENEEYYIKIVDFGTANYCNDNQDLNLKVGTAYYIAPEVIKNKYDKQCDVWSCGVILYIFLCGYPPFEGDNDDDIMNAILHNNLDFPKEEWDYISKEAIDLVIKMLHKDPKKRILAKDAINHKWFNLNDDPTDNKINIGQLNKSINNLKKFAGKDKLQTACLSFLVNHIGDNEQVTELKKLFKALDKSNDGRLSYEEIINGLKKMESTLGGSLEVQNLEKILMDVDTDNSGYIEYQEFMVATVDKQLLLSQKNLKMAFNYFDKNRDGQLDKKEVKNLLILLSKKDVLVEEIKMIISEIDKDDDGEINFEEFKGLMNKVLA